MHATSTEDSYFLPPPFYMLFMWFYRAKIIGRELKDCDVCWIKGFPVFVVQSPVFSAAAATLKRAEPASPASDVEMTLALPFLFLLGSIDGSDAAAASRLRPTCAGK